MGYAGPRANAQLECADAPIGSSEGLLRVFLSRSSVATKVATNSRNSAIHRIRISRPWNQRGHDSQRNPYAQQQVQQPQQPTLAVPRVAIVHRSTPPS